MILSKSHLKLSKTNSYDGWIWACVSMWAFDRFARLLRVIILNARAFSSDPANHHLARAKFVKGTDIIQLTVYPSAEDVGYFPGAHFFVFLTGSWRFWECHPFTAADWRPSEPTLTGMPQRTPSGARSLSESLMDSLNGSLSKEIGVRRGTPRGRAVVGRSGSGRSTSGRSGGGGGVNRSSSGRSGVMRSGSGRSSSGRSGVMRSGSGRSGRSGMARSGSGRSKNSRSERDRSRGGSRDRTRLRGGELDLDGLPGSDLGLRGGGLDIEDAEAILGLRGGDLHRQKSRNIYIVKQNGNQGSIFVVSDTGKGRPIFDASGAGGIERIGTPRGGLERSKSETTRKELAKAKIAKAQEVARAKEAAAKAKEAIRIYELTKAKELAKARAELAKFRQAATPPVENPDSEKRPASSSEGGSKSEEPPKEPPLNKEKEPVRAVKAAAPRPESSKRKPKRTHSKTETKEERAAAREKRAEKRRKRVAEKDEEPEVELETDTEDINAGAVEKYVPDLRGINEGEDDDDPDQEKLALELALGNDLDDDEDEDEGMSIEKELEMLKQRQREEAEARRRAIELEEEQGDLSQILVATRMGSVNRPPGHPRGPPRPKLTFLIKPRKGMTATLAGMIRENDEAQRRRGITRIKELEIKCLIEGAYGINRPMHLFETAVVIAGGVGVTTILPYLADFVDRSRGVGPDNRTLTRRFVFVWTAREEELVENVVVKRFPKGVLNREDVSLQLYVTRKKAEGEKKLPGVRYRRPNIPEILAAEKRRLVGRMAVLSCGPSVLVDITRNAVVECLTQERKHVQYFEESYGW
ncbi:hypothetical protein C7212DRAFT_286213 [Tuber magnatum]|uniref:Ferric reductase NAD binding domain-containing protein n=1 Tax=Tuber magnatum TaxID=42249 RepID=A0A317SDS0_9PEZI|nr:hypothetical protein C7212DRAFT_286213 [Tuber magnatum]